MNRRQLFALPLAGAIAACSPLPTDTVAPRVSVAGLRIIEVGLLEQRYGLRLRVQNPNEFAFAVTAMDYALEINGHEFAQGVSSRRLDVPAYSERLLQVEVSSGLADLFEQLRAFESGRMSALVYRIHGHLRLEGRSARVPFEHAARLLPAQPGTAPGSGTIRSTAASPASGAV